MDLWTEYEGRTIAGDYYLETLLRSEGRSAFFKTTGKENSNAVIRLTEAHFDEKEMMERWRQVAAVKHDHLIEIRQVGQTTLDGVALAYALLEPSDANLDDVLKERPLTADETTDVGRAVVSALSALQGSDMVHEHIIPANVLAVGETVKLRSDCVRECVVDMEFSTAEDCEDLRRRDVHDVGVLLLQCLTLGREWQPSANVPKPFQRIIPGAINGTMTLAEIESALAPPASAAAAAPVYTTPGYTPPAYAAPAAGAASGTTAYAVPATPVMETHARLVPQGVLGDRSAAQPAQAEGADAVAPVAPAPQFRARNDAGLQEHTQPPYLLWIMGAVALLAVVLLGWHFFGNSATPASKAAAAPVAAPTAAATAKPSAAQSDGSPRVVVGGPAASRSGWYVVAYTYNRESQAQGKVAQLRRVHNSLHPQVFTPSGHAPYLVTLGGPMNNKEAGEILRRAHKAGMPRDTFVRNY